MYTLGGVKQLGFVVGDALGAAERWLAAGAAGPFFHLAAMRFEDWRYHGEPQQLTLDIAFAQCGDVMIEFIQPSGAWPNVYGERPPASGAIVPHHHAYLVPDVAAAGDRLGRGAPLTSAAVAPGAELRYYDLRETLGTIVELITDCAHTRAFFDLTSNAAIGWRGEDPIRAMPTT